MGVRDYLKKFIKRRTPVPLDKDVFNLGIQERRHPQHILGPVLYNVANQSTVVRTCITQLKTEIFRRGYVWEKAFVKQCVDCKTKYDAVAVEGALIKFLNPLANKETYGEHFQGLSGKDKLRFK